MNHCTNGLGGDREDVDVTPCATQVLQDAEDGQQQRCSRPDSRDGPSCSQSKQT